MLRKVQYNIIIDQLKRGNNFAFARFNDGEMLGVAKVGTVAARGCQHINEELHSKLNFAIKHEQDGYWKGRPCKTCFPRHSELYDKLVGEYKQQVYAVTLCNNGYWKNAVEDLTKICQKRNVIWISGNDQDLGHMKNILKFNIVHAYYVPIRDGWQFYETLKNTVTFNKDDLVLLSCGPMSRVLACEWFIERPDVTFLDTGSLFDPYTRNVWHGCHTGRLKYCPECNYV